MDWNGEFNSDDHYNYYCGQKSLTRNGVEIIVYKKAQNAVTGYNLKNDRIISACFQDKSFNITVIQVYASARNAEEADVDLHSWRSYEDPQDLLELTPKKDVLFIIWDWNAKEGSRQIPEVTENSFQTEIWPWSTKQSRFCTSRVLPRKCAGHSKHPLPTTQEKTLHMDINRWSIPKSDWL